MSNEKYSSIPETKEHICKVRNNIRFVIYELLNRSMNHDKTKMENPELEIFDFHTSSLKGLTYGSDEYKKVLSKMKPALEHHYANNNHHPEHFQAGIRGMNLIDLIEMFCDWYAATKRHADGDIMKSIEINKIRFGYNDLMEEILKNTADFLNNQG